MSMSSRGGRRRKLGRVKVAGEPEEERGRLLGQLGGTCTWIQSQHELAQEQANAKEEAKQNKVVQASKRKARRSRKKKGHDPLGILGGGPSNPAETDPAYATLLEDEGKDG